MKLLLVLAVAVFLAACSGVDGGNSCVPAPAFDAPNWATCNAGFGDSSGGE